MRLARLAWTELQRFRDTRLQFVPMLLAAAPIAVILILLISLWNPSARLENVPAAVVNEDTATTLPASGSEPPQKVDAGAALERELKATRSYDWRFTSRSEAERLLRNGSVYFTIIIPDGFSQKVARSLSQQTSPPVLQLRTNDANGFMSTPLASQQMNEVREQAQTIVLNYLARNITQEWNNLREQIEQLTRSAQALTAPQPSQAPPPAPAPAQPGVAQPPITSLEQLTQRLSQASADASQLSTTLQQLGTAGAKMTWQINDTTAAAQRAADSANSTDQTLTRQNTTDASTSARLAQSDVGTITTQVQSATDQANTLLSQLSGLPQSAQNLTEQLKGLKGQFESVSRSFPAAAGINSTSRDLQQPVTTEQVTLNPARTTGRGLAPVALILTASLTALIALQFLRPYNPRALTGNLTAFTTAAAGLLPLAALTTLTTLTTYVIAETFLTLDAKQPWLTLALLALAAVATAASAHALKILLGTAGEALFAVLLAFQVAASGALYPPQASPSLYAALNPYLPFTFTLKATRTTITGGPATAVWQAAIILAVLSCIALTLTAILLRRRRTYTPRTLHPAIHPRTP
ncbi:YhgE/Pip family protein [Streptomyces sp. NPDC096030]|uniref:YhgE/Pip domain-containing protein n=1 Tax=Streptomyces sp. NPDC096030 TaxID=3155423 RepID=UPI0033293381